jgi:hypothetical protein
MQPGVEKGYKKQTVKLSTRLKSLVVGSSRGTVLVVCVECRGCRCPSVVLTCVHL